MMGNWYSKRETDNITEWDWLNQNNSENENLTPEQIVHLASAISANNMAAIAEGYLDISDEIIKNIKFETKDSAEAFNREIIKNWIYKNPENQLKVK